MSRRQSVCVVGLGRIGLPTAVAFSRAGHRVVGVDSDPAVLERIRAKNPPFVEPGLTDADLDALELTRSVADAQGVDAWIVAVGTNVHRRCDATVVHDVAREIAEIANSGALLAIESTVPPGTSEEIAALREDLHIAHCPERAAAGRVLDEIASSPRLIGGTSIASTKLAVELYGTISATIVPCTARQSELAKLAENAYRAANVQFANDVAAIARDFELDPFELIDLANTHPRVSILRPGLGAGGDCLPMAARFFGGHDVRPIEEVVQLVAEVAPDAGRIAVFGSTFKPDVRYDHDPRRDALSPASSLISAFEERGFEVAVHDPSLGASVEAVVDGAEVIVFACAHSEYRTLDPASLGAPRPIVDPVAALDVERFRAAGWCVLR